MSKEGRGNRAGDFGRPHFEEPRHSLVKDSLRRAYHRLGVEPALH
jgi:hypothetical protein